MDKGAHFFRTDLQVHTPRDINWKGDKPTDPKGRSSMAARMVRACRDKGIGAIAITDHHDFAFVRYIQKAAAAETDERGETLPESDRLVVFPGLELTLAVPCQALLILDAQFPDDRFDSVLVALKIEPTDAGIASHAHLKRLPFHDLSQLAAQLDQQAFLKGRYIVLPNVTDGGLGTLLRPGMAEKYATMPFVGGYIDAGAKIGEGNRKILSGLDSAYGNKKIAVVYTSDSRSETFSELGKHTTWIKWAEPTAEALRQACLASESRISRERPQIPETRLTQLSVSNSAYMGPIEIELNSQFNSLIGGRGTGKSTVLEYIRWALCDQPPGPNGEDELSNLMSRRRTLIESTLESLGAHVDAHFVVNGIPHIVRRRSKPQELRLRVGDGEFRPVTESDVRQLLPIEAYSQRQLSTVGVRLEEVTRFVVGPIRVKLDELRARETAIAAQLRENFAVVQRWREANRGVRRDELQLASLSQQADNLRKDLATTTPEDQAVIAEKPGLDKADDGVNAVVQRLNQISSELSEFRSTVARLSSNLPALDGDEVRGAETLKSIDASAAAALTLIKSALDAAQRDFDAALAADSQLRTAEAKWRGMFRDFNAAYQEATKRAAAHVSQIKALEDIEKTRTSVAEQLQRKKAQLAKMGSPVDAHKTLRGQWVGIQTERSHAIKEQCDRLINLSNSMLRAKLEVRAEVNAISDRFRGAITGSGVRGNKIDAFIAAITAAEDPLKAWLDAIDELESRVVARDDAEAPTPAQTSVALRAFAPPEIEKIVAKLNLAPLLDLTLVPLDDRPVFEYATKPGEFIPFSKASPGQQATALLQVLLAQPGPPLLIDQPEDDLDSQVVLQVAEHIWAAKTRRQLIFASHNANLVVNGDAELVICCDYRKAGDQSGGQIKLEGSIDVPAVRKEITAVMEGGERAFRMRQQKYGF